jgi:predicted nucleic acid-binding protein
MTAPVFVDTNVLLYDQDPSEGDKHVRAKTWMEHLWRSRRGRLGYQVLAEFYVNATRKLKPGMDAKTARAAVRALEAWAPVPVTAKVLDLAWAAQDAHRLSWWDSLVVGAAQTASCRYLLTEDFNDGQELGGGLRVVNPFRHEPPEVVD